MLHTVLDHGFIKLIDIMGTDAANGSESNIRASLQYDQFSSFKLCELLFQIRIPTLLWVWWHPYGSIADIKVCDLKYQTKHDEWRQSEAGDYFDDEFAQVLSSDELDLHEHIDRVCHDRSRAGVTMNQLYKDLPLATYIQMLWKINLGDLLQFLLMYLVPNDQFEMAQYAQTIGYNIVAHQFPLTWKAFLDYQFNTFKLSDPEIQVLANLGMPTVTPEAFEKATRDWDECERKEFRLKLKLLGEFI